MKIVIVEDEIRIREGLIRLLEKSERKHEVVGVAENGIEGLEVIERECPDLVITDIRMPKMDGLQMLEALHIRNAASKAIVLSAYSEFAYAQQAIKLGVSEYLIKPIAPEEVLLALKNAEAQIAHEQSLRTQSPEQLRTLKNVFYSVLLGGMIVDSELESFLSKTYHFDVKSEIAVLDIYLGDDYKACYKPLCKELHCLIVNEAFEFYFLENPLGKNSLLVIYNMADTKATEKFFSYLIKTQIKTPCDCNAAFGWIRFFGLGCMKENIERLHKLLDWSMVLGKNEMICCENIGKVQFETLPYPIDLESRAKSYICSLDYKKLEETFSLFLRHLKSRMFRPAEMKETMIRFIWSAISVLKELDFSVCEKLQQQAIMERIVTAVTYDELSNALKELSHALYSVKKGEVKSLTIRRAKSMVHEYYSQGITLDEISSKLSITPEYLGTLFQKELGENFSSYIKRYRINKAKGLLIGTDMKLYEVSAAIGYVDPKYFSRVFREVTGQLPADFRKLNK